MRRIFLLSSVPVLVAATLSFSACTDTDVGGTPTPSPQFSTPTATAGLCDPAPCDEPGAAAFGGSFAIVGSDTDKDGTNDAWSVEGTMVIDLYEFDGTDVGTQRLCTQQFDFTADLVNDAITGCDENGANCTQICPYDDPGVAGAPIGTCIGHFGPMTIDSESYQTDCSFVNEVDWFHPDAGNNSLNEQWLLSYPIESSTPTGSTNPATWGAWGDAVVGSGSAYDGWGTHAQVTFGNRFVNGDWSSNSFLFGITATDPALDGDSDGSTDQPNAEGLGNHTFVNLFVLTFGG